MWTSSKLAQCPSMVFEIAYRWQVTLVFIVCYAFDGPVSAVFNAVSQGAKKIIVAVVCTDMEYVITPCGACRQVLVEFGLEDCFCLSLNDIIHKTAEELLPNSCRIDHLKKE